MRYNNFVDNARLALIFARLALCWREFLEGGKGMITQDLSKQEKLEQALSRYAPEEGSLISILQETQGIFGYIPADSVYTIGRRLNVTPAKIMGVATFYSQFRLKPVGKYLIQLCQGTACHVNGSERIEQVINEALGIKDGETTEDGLFTLESVACLGCCSLSPVMMINGEAYGNLTADKVRSILKDMAAGEEGKA